MRISLEINDLSMKDSQGAEDFLKGEVDLSTLFLNTGSFFFTGFFSLLLDLFQS